LLIDKKGSFMTDKTLYTESQRFKQIIVWVLLIAIFIFVSTPQIYILIKQVFLGIPVGNRPMSNVGVWVVTSVSIVIPLLVIQLFLLMKLETKIAETGIYVRYLPFQMKFKFYSWSDLSKCYVRQYNPVGEYGGWGMKGMGKNKALNISGNNGIQLETNDGNKLLIGTNNPDEVTNVLHKSGHWKE